MLPANRVAALVGVLTGLAGFITGLAGVLPGQWPSSALAIAGLITTAAHALHFMSGSQKIDAHEAAQAVASLQALAGGHDIAGLTEGVKADGFVAAGETEPPPPPAVTSAAQPAP